MTIRVTVHHAHGENFPQDWRIEVLKPPKGQVLRSEPEEGGHVLEFEVASNTRELAYVCWPAWTDKPQDAEPIVLELAADSDQQEFRRDEADLPAAVASETARDEEAAAKQRDEGQVETAKAGTEEDETDEGRLDELAQHVNQQLARVWKAIEDVAYRVTLVENGFADHLAAHAPIPVPIPRGPGTTTGRGDVIVPQPPTGLEAAVLIAVAATKEVRDGFLDASETFAAQLGLQPGADGATTAGRLLEQLTLAANSADSAVAVYEAEPSRNRRDERLALVAFAGKVRNAGNFYNDTVAQVAAIAARTSDPGEQAAYTDVLMTLRSAPVGPALDLLRTFNANLVTADRVGPRRTDRQGVTS
jgi:hypothetical protein